MNPLLKDAIIKELDNLHIDGYVQAEAERIIESCPVYKGHVTEEDKNG